MLDSDEEGLTAKQQIPYLTETRFYYTDSGLFVYFGHDIGIEKFRTTNLNLVLDGIKIEAQATLFLITELLTT